MAVCDPFALGWLDALGGDSGGTWTPRAAIPSVGYDHAEAGSRGSSRWSDSCRTELNGRSPESQETRVPARVLLTCP